MGPIFGRLWGRAQPCGGTPAGPGLAQRSQEPGRAPPGHRPTAPRGSACTTPSRCNESQSLTHDSHCRDSDSAGVIWREPRCRSRAAPGHSGWLLARYSRPTGPPWWKHIFRPRPAHWTLQNNSPAAAPPARSRLAASVPSRPRGQQRDPVRQPFRPLFVVSGTVFTASSMADGYGNTMRSLIGGLAAQAAAAGGRRSSAGHRAAALSRQTCAQVIN